MDDHKTKSPETVTLETSAHPPAGHAEIDHAALANRTRLLDRLNTPVGRIVVTGLVTTVAWVGAETVTQTADAKTTPQKLGLVAHEAASKSKNVALPKIVPGETIGKAAEDLRKKGFKPGGVVPRDGWPNAKPGNTFEADGFATRIMKRIQKNGKTFTKKVYKPVTGKLKSKSRVYIIPDQVKRKATAPLPVINKPPVINGAEIVSATPAPVASPESETKPLTPEIASFDRLAEIYKHTQEVARTVPLLNTCSAQALYNEAGVEIGAVSANHCDSNQYIQGSDGIDYLVTDNTEIKKGARSDSLETVARATHLLRPVAPEQNDQTLIVYAGSNPGEVQAAHAKQQLSPVEIRQLTRGTKLHASAYPLNPTPRQRQDLEAEMVGTAAVGIREGTLYQVIVAGIKENANGASASAGASGAGFELDYDAVDSNGKQTLRYRLGGTALAYDSFDGPTGESKRVELEAQYGVSFDGYNGASYIATRTGPLKETIIVGSSSEILGFTPPA